MNLISIKINVFSDQNKILKYEDTSGLRWVPEPLQKEGQKWGGGLIELHLSHSNRKGSTHKSGNFSDKHTLQSEMF